VLFSILLTFALTELEEERKEVASARDHFESLISHLSTEVDELKSTIDAEVNAARGPEISAPVGGVDDEMNGADEAARLVEEREARGKLVLERRGREVSEVETAIGVVWVMYMRFARRSEVSPNGT
jgi:cleavage stimulation factor subunit 3